MTDRPLLTKLEALLARIQRRAGEPRPARIEVAPHSQAMAPAMAPAMARHATDVSDAPSEPMELEPLATQAAVGPPAATVSEARAPEPEAISGEYAVYRDEPAIETSSAQAEPDGEPMELEELGPADEMDLDETVVEINVEEPTRDSAEVTVHTESGPAPAPVDEPPASGRELVAAPHESARMKVSAPLTDQHLERSDLEPSLEPAPEPSFDRAPPPPPHPRSPPPARPLSPVAPAPVQSPPSPPPAAFERAPSSVPSERAPITAPSAPPPPPLPPEQVAVAVALRAPAAQAPRATEPVTVSIDAVVIRPSLTPSDVAAFVEATRAPTPTTFGALLDAALSL